MSLEVAAAAASISRWSSAQERMEVLGRFIVLNATRHVSTSAKYRGGVRGVNYAGRHGKNKRGFGCCGMSRVQVNAQHCAMQHKEHDLWNKSQREAGCALIPNVTCLQLQNIKIENVVFG